VADQIVWLTNFKGKLASYATTLGLTAADVAAIVADCNWIIYLLQLWLPAIRAFGLSATQAANTAQTGSNGLVPALPVFTPPALPSGTVATINGGLNRIFALVQRIKTDGKSNNSINADLQIIGTEQSGPDLTILQPVITAKVNGNHTEIGWGWGGNAAYLDAIELQVDRGDGKGFVLLTIDTTPGYNDTQPFPTAPTRWSYRAIYRVNDQQVGLWSQTVSVMVPA
jgi:hypothetical protein